MMHGWLLPSCTVDRVMPEKGFDRPGWLRMEQFGAGMITGWGAHHVDTAHWGFLFLGTTKEFHLKKAPNPYVIVGVFPPKEQLQGSLL